jgi:hypothetical protein
MEEENQNDRDAAQDVQSLVSHFKRQVNLNRWRNVPSTGVKR